MRVSNFEASWKKAFDQLPPFGWALRKAFPKRWIRIHSLPGSKRLPTNDSDEQELLRRHQEVARVVLGASETPWCVAVCPQTQRADPQKESMLARMAAGWPRSEPSLRELAGGTWSDPVSIVVGRNSPSDSALLAIAHDRLRALWMHPETKEVMAPYDGGVDLILIDGSRTATLRQRFAKWLSNRDDGL